MGRARRPRPGWALPLAALLLCGPPSGCARAGAPRPSFVLVVIDTLRADHLHHAGHPAPSPHFDALERRSTRFARAYANAPWTLPSLASLFLSQIGSQHHVVTWGAELPEAEQTLPELLRGAGYRTAAFTANVLIGRDSGFAQGFDVYDVIVDPAAHGRRPGEPFPNAPAERVTLRALAWLRARDGAAPDAPFFAYLHYMEPHTPYRCGRAACAAPARALNRRLMAEQWDFSLPERARIRALYRSDVAAMDRALGRLLAALEAEPFWRETWVVVTSDHGESLGETGLYLHGHSLEDREIRVPLLVSGPARGAGVVREPVSLIDVAPTVLDLAGLDAPPAFRGRSLRPALEGRPLAPRPVVSEIFQTTTDPPRHRLAVVAGGEKLVLTPGGELSRFDLGEDPDERHPEPATPPDLDRLLGPLAGWVDLDARPEAPALSPEVREQLRALGYAAD